MKERSQNGLFCLMVLWYLLSGPQLLAQKTFPVSNGYLEQLPKVEILRGKKSSAKSYLNQITADSLRTLSLVGANAGELTLYTYSYLALDRVGQIRVTKAGNKLIPRIVGGLLLGGAGALIGRQFIAKEEDTVLNSVLADQEDNKLFPTLIGGILGAGLGVAIGGFASGKKFHFDKDQKAEVARLRRFAGELPPLKR